MNADARPWRSGGVVLVGLRRTGNSTLAPGDERFGLRLIAKALDDRGLPALILPTRECDTTSALAEIREALSRHPEGGILGISTDSHHFPIACRLADWGRRVAPEWLIVSGGPHFNCSAAVSEEAPAPFDLIVVGHAQSFVEVVQRADRGALEVTRDVHPWRFTGDMPRGVRYLDHAGQRAGSGVGTAPPVGRDGAIDVRALSPEKAVAMLLLDERCRNGCDYCFARRPYQAVDVARERAALSKAAASFEGELLVDLLDNNPVAGGALGPGASLLQEVAERHPTKTRGILYVDASALVSSADALTGLEAAGALKGLYIGRDVVSPEIARRIGRRLAGRIRTADDLAAEQEALLRFVTRCAATGASAEITVEYLLTPYERPDTFPLMLDEMTRVALGGGNGTRVAVEYQIVCPFPGTRLFRDARGTYLPPEHAPDYLSSYWHPRSSSGATFLKLVELVLYPDNRLVSGGVETAPDRQAALLWLCMELAFDKSGGLNDEGGLEPEVVAFIARARAAWAQRRDLEDGLLGVYTERLRGLAGWPEERVRGAVEREAALLLLHRQHGGDRDLRAAP